jgi:hypothetical protein
MHEKTGRRHNDSDRAEENPEKPKDAAARQQSD